MGHACVGGHRDNGVSLYASEHQSVRLQGPWPHSKVDPIPAVVLPDASSLALERLLCAQVINVLFSFLFQARRSLPAGSFSIKTPT